MAESLVREFDGLLDERLDVQDVVCEAQNLLRLSRPITAVYSITRKIIWYESTILNANVLGGLTKSRPHDRTRPHSPTTTTARSQ